jgi:Fe-Mn family superoxide dismutase
MTLHVRPLPFKPSRLKGLSPRLIASHYENNYGAAVRRLNVIRGDLAGLDPAAIPPYRLNGLKREELIAANSMLLHELYFDGLGEGGGGDPDGALAETMARDFGSIARWRAEFVAMGKALGGGSGWVLLARSPREGRLSNVWASDHSQSMAGGTPILALDMYEHSYHMEFGTNAGAYVEAFMANIAWPRVAARYAGVAAETRQHMIAAPDAQKLLASNPDLIVIDARLEDDAAAVPVRLRGARRAPPGKVEEVAATLPTGAKVLVYCAWGFEVGGECAAEFRDRGIDAMAIAGGIGAWRADGLPTEPLKSEPRKEGDKK